jgi:DNA-directed RNA polymerase subunit RPC12/RpoP
LAATVAATDDAETMTTENQPGTTPGTTGIECERCGEGILEQPADGAQYECPRCGVVVAPEVARRGRQ